MEAAAMPDLETGAGRWCAVGCQSGASDPRLVPAELGDPELRLHAVWVLPTPSGTAAAELIGVDHVF